MSLVWSIVLLWVDELDTTLHIRLSGMSRRPSGSIKSKTSKLWLEFAMYMVPKAVLFFILMVASSSPVMWTQSPEALCATWLVDVNEGWPMVSHRDCNIRVISEAMSTCGWTGWPFNYTATYFQFDFGFGRKVTTRLFVFVLWCWWLLCEVCLLFMAQSIAAAAVGCLECTVPYKMPAA